MNTNDIWNNNVLNIDINAEIVPLFNAVKNDDEKIEKPENINANEHIFIALDEMANNSSLPLAKKLENNVELKKLIIDIIIPVIAIII